MWQCTCKENKWQQNKNRKGCISLKTSRHANKTRVTELLVYWNCNTMLMKHTTMCTQLTSESAGLIKLRLTCCWKSCEANGFNCSCLDVRTCHISFWTETICDWNWTWTEWISYKTPDWRTLHEIWSKLFARLNNEGHAFYRWACNVLTGHVFIINWRVLGFTFEWRA